MDLVFLAVTKGDVLIWSTAVAGILAAVTYIAGSAKAYDQIGKAMFVMDSDLTEPGAGARTATKAEREAEIRQLLEAKAFRQRARGEQEIDVDAELERMLAETAPSASGADPALAEEIRQMVVARNDRRERKGEPPLDVEAEVARRVAELENLGQ